MDGLAEKCPELGYPFESGDVKYVSGLSTILVATIQEAKDRISQIEYIFCSQLFPNIQSKSQSLQKIYCEARKAAEDEWKEKENKLVLEIKRLQLEKQQALEEIQSVKLEKAELSEQEERLTRVLAQKRILEEKVNELEFEFRLKAYQVNEGLELQSKLRQLVQSKTVELADKGKQLKEHDLTTNELLEELEASKKKVDQLQGELRGKNVEVALRNEIEEAFNKKIESQTSKLLNYEEKLIDHEKEKKLLTVQLKCLQENVDELQQDLRKKTEEVEEGRKLQEQLIQKIDSTNSETFKSKQQINEHEEEKKLLLQKVEGLEEKVEEHQVERSDEVAGGRESYEKLLHCIECKAAELASEKNKRRDVIAAYKRLKSQYNFLCSKFGLTAENTPLQHTIEEENDSLRHNQKPRTPTDHDNDKPDTSTGACNTMDLKNARSCLENLDGEKGAKLPQASTSRSPSSFISLIASKCPVETKSAPLAGTKRPASRWIETRSRQQQGGPDPHDDFLDTPFENIKGNMNKAAKEEAHDLPVPVPTDMNFDSSDDETQAVNDAPSPRKQQMPNLGTSTRGYKYVEPVRKKAERDNLKGVECKQCKKFYDAVLPDGGCKNTDGSTKNIRCEHHDGVSRHRYRYVPPLTPEGFWNIGFDSEM